MDKRYWCYLWRALVPIHFIQSWKAVLKVAVNSILKTNEQNQNWNPTTRQMWTKQSKLCYKPMKRIKPANEARSITTVLHFGGLFCAYYFFSLLIIRDKNRHDLWRWKGSLYWSTFDFFPTLSLLFLFWLLFALCCLWSAAAWDLLLCHWNKEAAAHVVMMHAI